MQLALHSITLRDGFVDNSIVIVNMHLSLLTFFHFKIWYKP